MLAYPDVLLESGSVPRPESAQVAPDVAKARRQMPPAGVNLGLGATAEGGSALKATVAPTDAATAGRGRGRGLADSHQGAAALVQVGREVRSAEVGLLVTL